MQVILLCLNVNVTNKISKHNCLIKFKIATTATSFVSVCYPKHNGITLSTLTFAKQASIHQEDGLKEPISFIMSVVCFLLGNSKASEFYVPTFQNTVPSSYIPAYEDGTDRVF
jgi:hypothetical protein